MPMEESHADGGRRSSGGCCGWRPTGKSGLDAARIVRPARGVSEGLFKSDGKNGPSLSDALRQRPAMLDMTSVEESTLTPLFPPRAEGASLPTVCVVGLGYVGLPVAVAFGRHRATVGYDLSTRKIRDLKRGEDPTGEVASTELAAAHGLEVTDDPEQIK